MACDRSKNAFCSNTDTHTRLHPSLTDVLEVRVSHELHGLEVDLVLRQGLRVLPEPHVSQELGQIGGVSNRCSWALSLTTCLPDAPTLK